MLQVKTPSGGAWKTYEEIAPGLSPEKQASERKRRTVGLILGPLVFLICLILPLPLPFQANLAIGVTLFTMIWWVCEPIPMPATCILSVAAYVIFQLAPADAIFNQLGHNNTWTLLGTFIFMNALVKHGVTTRVAFWILSLPVGKKGPYALLSLYIVAICVVSSFLSNMATTMLFLVIAAGMLEALSLDSDHTLARAFHLGSAYASQAGGFGTPMGAAGTNFLAIGLIVSLTKYPFTVVDWIKVGMPFMVVMTITMILYFRIYFKFDLPNFSKAHEYARDQLKGLGPMDGGAKASVYIALVVVVLWLLPGIASTIWGNASPIYKVLNTYLNTAAVSCLGGALCFIIPSNRKEKKVVMTWTDANHYIDWGALLLVSTGLVMAVVLRAENVGVLAWFTKAVGGSLVNVPPIVAVLGMTAFAVIMTQIVSNIAAIAITLPVGYSVAVALGLNPVAMLMVLAFAAQQSFALPVAAPQTAFVYGTGGISMKDFVKCGGWLAIISIPITAFVGYYLCCAVFPM